VTPLEEYFCYTVIGIVTIAAIILIPQFQHPTYGTGHYMAVNLTRVNDTFCRLYWLGGTDYLSFIRDIRVGNVSVGHPEPGTMIYEGTECNTTVSMYFRDVKAYQTIWPEVGR
jgi:hypothetical protein